MAENLETMTRDQLVEQADALGLEIPKGASKAAVRSMVEDALAAHRAVPVPPVPPVPGALSTDQRKLLLEAQDAEIDMVLADMDVPAWCRAEFQVEKDKRSAASLRSEIEQWHVTKGGRYFIPGHGTTIPTGSVVSPLTHNLDDLRAQGIEIEPLKGSVEVFRDQLGFAKTRIIGG
jgi:hypothetical protein